MGTTRVTHLKPTYPFGRHDLFSAPLVFQTVLSLRFVIYLLLDLGLCQTVDDSILPRGNVNSLHFLVGMEGDLSDSHVACFLSVSGGSQLNASVTHLEIRERRVYDLDISSLIRGARQSRDGETHRYVVLLVPFDGVRLDKLRSVVQ